MSTAGSKFGGNGVAGELVRTVAELYDEHRQAAFPRRLILDEPHGVEMAGLDSRIAGCVHTWLEHGGRIHDHGWNTLAQCEQALRRAIPALDGDEASYCRRLLTMTVLILENPEGRPLD